MSNYNPLVSIIIPVYNGAQYLQIAVDSALMQTYKNVEIIVVNDGSTDDGQTDRIARSYGEKIRYFIKKNGGCASALNFGISQMRGEWFSWLSHDDVYEPTKIEQEINCVLTQNLNPKVTIVSCDAKIINENGKEILHPATNDVGEYKGRAFVERLLFGVALNGCGLLIPKTIIDKVGYFSTDLKFILDLEYWLRIALSGATLYRMGNVKLVMNRVHSGQVTVREFGHYKIEMEDTLNKLFPAVVSSNDVDIIKTFYIFVGVNRYSELQKKSEDALRSFNAYSLKLRWRILILIIKRKMRNFIAKVYWRIVRG